MMLRSIRFYEKIEAHDDFNHSNVAGTGAKRTPRRPRWFKCLGFVLRAPEDNRGLSGKKEVNVNSLLACRTHLK